MRTRMTDGLEFESLPLPDNCPLYAEAAAPSDKPVLVLLHGFMMSRAIWNENVEDLSKHFRLVRIEWLGHGRAGAPQTESAYSASVIIQTLNAFRTELGVDAWSLCAHSFGAGLAIRYGLDYPAHTRAIIITNSRSALGSLDTSSDDLKLMLAALETKGRDALENMPPHPRFMKNIPDDLKAELVEDAELISPDGVANLLSHTSAATNVVNELDRLQCPLMLANGRFERGFQPARKALQCNHPDLHIVDLDAGHSPNAEAPDAFNTATVDFIRSS